MAKTKVLSICPRWAPTSGGINALNYDLFTNISKYINKSLVDLTCCVLEASKSELADAQKKGISIVDLELGDSYLKKDFSPQLKVKLGEIDYVPDWIIGHDIMTGQTAINLSEIFKREAKHPKCAVFHHMKYEAYESLKSDYGVTDLSNKILLQQQIFPKCDTVFAVGTKLLKSAEDIIIKNNTELIEFIPGLPSVVGQDAPNSFKAIIFGRIDAGNINTKQFLLPIEAITKMHGSNKFFGNDATINLVGVGSDDNSIVQIISDIKEKYKCPSIAINPISYITERTLLHQYLSNHSICIVPSIQEGFGMVGWESIACEIPLMLSENSGLYEFIESNYGGSGTGNIIPIDIEGTFTDSPSEDDINHLCRLLAKFQKKAEYYKQNAKEIKHTLKAHYTWEQVAREFCANLKIQDIELQPLNIGSIAKNLNPIEASTSFNQILIREELIESLLVRLSSTSDVNEDLIFFGGISQRLVDENSFNVISNFLKSNNKNKITYCYETEEAAVNRAKLLNPDTIDSSTGLSKDLDERMKQKEELVKKFKSDLLKIKEIENSSDRIRFVPIAKPLTAYIVIYGEDSFITPLFEKRSSKTISFSIPEKRLKYRIDILRYMIYHLSTIEEYKEDTFVVELNDKLNKIQYEYEGK